MEIPPAYTISGVTPGTYTMKVSKKNHVTREYSVTVTSGTKTQNAEIHLLGDVNGDGKILVNVDAIFMGGSDQISIVNQQKLVTRLAAGDELFYIMDPKSYEEKIVNNLEAEGAVFFDKLDLEAEGVSENGLYWNWKGSDLQKHELLQNAPEDLYFGVRALYGSADSGKNDEKHDDCMALLKALITDTPLSSSEDGGN